MQHVWLLYVPKANSVSDERVCQILHLDSMGRSIGWCSHVLKKIPVENLKK